MWFTASTVNGCVTFIHFHVTCYAMQVPGNAHQSSAEWACRQQHRHSRVPPQQCPGLCHHTLPAPPSKGLHSLSPPPPLYRDSHTLTETNKQFHYVRGSPCTFFLIHNRGVPLKRSIYGEGGGRRKKI